MTRARREERAGSEEGAREGLVCLLLDEDALCAVPRDLHLVQLLRLRLLRLRPIFGEALGERGRRGAARGSGLGMSSRGR